MVLTHRPRRVNRLEVAREHLRVVHSSLNTWCIAWYPARISRSGVNPRSGVWVAEFIDTPNSKFGCVQSVMRTVATIGACVLCVGCIATHEPPVLRCSEAPQSPLPISIRVIPEPSRWPDLDRGLCERAVGDLRATQVFMAISDGGDLVGPVDLSARVSWHTLRQADDWCTAIEASGCRLSPRGSSLLAVANQAMRSTLSGVRMGTASRFGWTAKLARCSAGSRCSSDLSVDAGRECRCAPRLLAQACYTRNSIAASSFV
jgi:hypothetical protein